MCCVRPVRCVCVYVWSVVCLLCVVFIHVPCVAEWSVVKSIAGSKQGRLFCDAPPCESIPVTTWWMALETEDVLGKRHLFFEFFCFQHVHA